MMRVVYRDIAATVACCAIVLSAAQAVRAAGTLDLTFDPEMMSPEEFIAVLPKEFRKWRAAMATDLGLEAAE